MECLAEPTIIYLLGVNVGHSIAPPVHNYISTSLGLSVRFLAQECPTIEDAVRTIRSATFAGAVVTMPYKKTVLPYLDGLDELAIKLGACNNVYIAKDGSLRGTNTDWLGVAGCLITSSTEVMTGPALVVGAGGASKAAIYALSAKMCCKDIYIVNRDAQEVETLLEESKLLLQDLKLVHVRSTAQSRSLPSPRYIVGTIPDFPPQTPEEFEVRSITEDFLSRPNETGVLLDMCYKPRCTSLLKMGDKYAWKRVDGMSIVGYQVQEQYRLWLGEDVARRLPLAGAWEILHKVSAASPLINVQALP